MKQSFFSMFGLVYFTNDFLLTLIGIHSLICGSMWLGVACFILGLCGLSMMVVLFKKMVLTNVEENESGDVTSITVDGK